MILLTRTIIDNILESPAGRRAVIPYLPFLNDAMVQHEINTIARVSAFLGQIAHESAEFTRTTESLNYSADGLAATWKRFRQPNGTPTEEARRLERKPEAIANVVYADSGGNGPTSTSEGWKYRGRGLIQTTFKDNYRAVARATGVDVVANPELLAQPELAVKSACVYWSVHKINAAADAGDLVAVTKAINPAMLEHAKRVHYTQRARSALERGS